MSLQNLNKCFLVLFLLLNSIFASAGVPTRQIQLLSNNFNALTPGTPVGNGGPSVGEPVSVGSLQAHIQQISAINNAIIIEKLVNAYSGGHVRWEFLNETEVIDGSIIIAFDFTPTDLDNFSLLIRERGGSSQAFMDLIYDETGSYQVNDQSGAIPFASGSYSADQPQQIVMIFDMDAGTSELSVNGNNIFSGREHGVINRGVGSLLTGYGSLTEFSPFLIDNIKVLGDVALPLVLDVDLEDKPLGQAIGTGGPSVGEPVSFSSAVPLNTEVISYGLDNQALLLERVESASAQVARFEFLNDLEMTSGLVVIEMDLEFDRLASYSVSIRENGTSIQNFIRMTFGSTGSIFISDETGSAGSVGNYQVNRKYRLRLIYDLDEGSYDVLLDNQALIDGRSYGDTEGRGIGKITVGFASNTDVGSEFILDNLQVGSSFIADDIIYADGFEPL